MEERANATYAYILEGGTRRQIVERTAARFNTIRTAHDDYSRAVELLKNKLLQGNIEPTKHYALREREKLGVNYKRSACC